MYLTVPVKLVNFIFFDANHSINKVIQIEVFSISSSLMPSTQSIKLSKFKFILAEVTNDAAPLCVGNMLLCLRVDVRLGQAYDSNNRSP